MLSIGKHICIREIKSEGPLTIHSGTMSHLSGFRVNQEVRADLMPKLP
jgi:hypothetical protein